LRDAPPGGIMWISDALVAQPDRASDYESEGRRFESCRARSRKSCKCRYFASTNQPEGWPVPPDAPLGLFGTASQGACRCDLDVPVLDPVRLHCATAILFLPTVIRAAASSTVCSGGGRHRSRPTISNPRLDTSTLQSSVQSPTTRSFLRSESRAGRHYSILGNRINDRY
jgi:hypothetical protein